MTIGCCATHASTRSKKAVLNGKASPVAMQAAPEERRSEQPRRFALPPLEKPKHAERQRRRAGPRARARERTRWRRPGACSRAGRDGRRVAKASTAISAAADGDADLAPAQRRADHQAVVIESRYQGRTSCRGGIPVLCAPPLKLERVRLDHWPSKNLLQNLVAAAENGSSVE